MSNCSLMIWASPRGLGHCSAHSLCAGPLAGSPPPRLLFLVVTARYRHLQIAPSLPLALPPPQVSPELSSRCQASTSLHDVFNPEISTATEAAPSPVASRNQWLFITPSYLQNQRSLGDSCTLPTLAAKAGCNFGSSVG